MMERKAKISTGANDRPRNETIGQTGEGLPDDSARPLDTDEREIDRTREQLQDDAREKLRKELKKEIELPQKGSV
ncbi:hypothetical protein [Phyllobacterium phragmitis]